MIYRKMASAARSFRIGLIQMLVSGDKNENLKRATRLISEAKQQGSSVIVLPECFNSPYGTKYFPTYAECIPDGETCKILSEAAKQNQVYLIGGSIPEECNNKYYNTCTIWGPDGRFIDYHRKIHLFDIDVPGGIKFTESETLSPGEKFTVVDIGLCKIGIGICYDLRFPELTRVYRKEGIDMLLFPAAFNMTTGPLHWELLMRGRANDEQVFVAACSPAQSPDSDYKAYGHSIIVDPWGKVIKQAVFDEEIVIADIDLKACDDVRQAIPTFKQRRTDLYETVNKSQL